jgi:predicted RNA-binding Zn-ribbon protein involved in translation (DUF1610 family)
MITPLPLGTVLPKPFCAACGHDLSGAVTSASCPECGRPLVEVLVREHRLGSTRRYTSKRRVLGLPLLSIALGPDSAGKMGHAKGYFAVGDTATGVFAFGGLARGVVAFGGVALGGVTFGGLSIGTCAAFGGGAIALLGSAVGGFAAGIVAAGGGAIGVIAQGGFAMGWLARGGAANGVHGWSSAGRGSSVPDAATQALFDQYAWLIGPSGAAPQIQYNLVWTGMIAVAVIVLALTPLLLARAKRDPVAEELNR